MLRLLLLPAALLLTAPAFAVPDISVARAPNEAGWDITLSPALADKVMDRMWLVVDGKSKMINYGDFYAAEARKPLRYQAKADSTLDSNVKQILTAQGLAIKPDVTTYFFSYSLNGINRLSGDETLHFRTMQATQAYIQTSSIATYKVGDRITLYGVVAMNDESTLADLNLPPGVKSTMPPAQPTRFQIPRSPRRLKVRCIASIFRCNLCQSPLTIREKARSSAASAGSRLACR